MYAKDIDIVRMLLEDNPAATDQEIVDGTHLTTEQVQFARQVLATFSKDAATVFEVLNGVQAKVDKRLGRKKN
jgi:hypothetical protein